MRRAIALLAATGAALAVGVTAGSPAVVLKTNWVEKTQVSWGGWYTVYVRRIDFTRTRWRAAVGLVNKTSATIRLQYGASQQGPRSIFFHGPGIWFRAPAAPGLPSEDRWVAATSMKPSPLPHVLRSGQSWFATIEGPTAKLPRDRLLRIGFAFVVREGEQYPTEISTTHQFRLPKGLR